MIRKSQLKIAVVFLVYFFAIYVRMLINLHVYEKGDPYRYHELFYAISNGEDFWYYLESNFDPLFLLFSYIFANIHPELPIILMAITLAVALTKLQKYLDFSFLMSIFFTLLVLLPFYTPANYITGAWRQSFALAVMIIGLIDIEKDKVVTKGYVLLIASCLIHSAQLLILSPFILLLLFKKLGSSGRNLTIGILLLILLISALFSYGDLVMSLFLNKVNHYDTITDRIDVTLGIYKVLIISIFTLISIYLVYTCRVTSCKKIHFSIICLNILVFAISNINEALAVRLFNGYYYVLPIIYWAHLSKKFVINFDKSLLIHDG